MPAPLVAAIAGGSLIGAAALGKPGKQKAKTVNIPQADAAAREYADKNIQDAIRLEQKYSPETYGFRQQSMQALADESARATNTADMQAALRARFDQGFSPSALTQAAYDRATSDLALGGALPLDVQNQITRQALAGTARGTGGLGLGRDVVARDLGLGSMQLRNQRLATAQDIGTAYDRNQLAQLQAQQALAGAVTDLGQAELSRRLNLAQFGQAIQRPESGLTRSDVVNLMVGNTNTQNAVNAQNAANKAAFTNSLITLGGQVGGAALGGYLSGGGGATTAASSAPLTPSSAYSNTFTGGLYP